MFQNQDIEPQVSEKAPPFKLQLHSQAKSSEDDFATPQAVTKCVYDTNTRKAAVAKCAEGHSAALTSLLFAAAIKRQRRAFSPSNEKRRRVSLSLSPLRCQAAKFFATFASAISPAAKEDYEEAKALYTEEVDDLANFVIEQAMLII